MHMRGLWGVMTGDPFPAKEIYEYKPLACINDRIYGDIGIVAKSSPEGFELAKTVKEKNIGVSAVYCYIDGTCYASSEKLCDQFKAFFEDDLK